MVPWGIFQNMIMAKGKNKATKKHTRRQKWRSRLCELAADFLLALPCAFIYIIASDLLGCTIVRRVPKELFWIIVAIPVFLLPIRAWLKNDAGWRTILLNAVIGYLVGYALCLLTITVWLGANYLFARSECYQRRAVVYAMKEKNHYRQMAHLYIGLRFVDNGEVYNYDGNRTEYDRLQPGDTCMVTLCDGLLGYPVIHAVRPVARKSRRHPDITSLQRFVEERYGGIYKTDPEP